MLAKTRPPRKTRFGDALTAARMDRGISLRRLARESGVHLATICRVIRGEHCPRLELVSRLAIAMDLPLLELVHPLAEDVQGGVYTTSQDLVSENLPMAAQVARPTFPGALP